VDHEGERLAVHLGDEIGKARLLVLRVRRVAECREREVGGAGGKCYAKGGARNGAADKS